MGNPFPDRPKGDTQVYLDSKRLTPKGWKLYLFTEESGLEAMVDAATYRELVKRVVPDPAPALAPPPMAWEEGENGENAN